MPLSKKKYFAYLVSTAIFLLIIFIIYCSFFTPSIAPQYLTAPVTISDIQDTVLASGTLEALQQVNVGAQVSGELTSLKVVLGQDVKKGQLVGEIDSLAQQNALENAYSALIQVRAQMRSKQASLVQLRLAFMRQKNLLAGEAGSRVDFESADAALQSGLADEDSLKAQIEQAKITVSTAQLNLGHTKIIAPMEGKVVAIVTKQGQTVNSAQLAPTIIILAELKTMTVKALISEADVIRVKSQQTVYFSMLGEPDHLYQGKLRIVEPGPNSISSDSGDNRGKGAANAAPVYYNALFEVPNPDNKLRISMTTQVSIVLSQSKSARVIPSTALGELGKDGRYQVKVLETKDKKKTVVTRKVKIGINNTQAEVLDGLKVGEQVVIGESGNTPKIGKRFISMG
ncbi:MAG: efflux RND transporter periplasmic adaptor subunit [Glaciimonas sp.]|nr:efflux RND transporter periplasmic adaptor subunit [Glaciimonas sp.]